VEVQLDVVQQQLEQVLLLEPLLELELELELELLRGLELELELRQDGPR
jgi:hypothetical protein